MRPRQALPLSAAVLVVTGCASTGPAPVEPTEGVVVSALAMGAVGDGVTDDGAALQAALDDLRPGDVLELPAGSTFAHDDVLTISVDRTTVTGGGVLLATDEESSAVRVTGAGVTLDGVVLATAQTTRRWTAPDQTGLWLDHSDGTTVQDVVVRDSPSAGIFVQGATGFRLLDVTVSGTRADGIHMTAGARDGLVDHATTRSTGDDGIAVVSYSDDREQAGDIEVVSPTVDGTTWGRGLAVVGGADVRFSDIDVRDTSAAAVYIACERGEFTTRVPRDVVVDGGTVRGANHDGDVDHGAVMVYNSAQDEVLAGVQVADLVIGGTSPSAGREVALLGDDGARLEDIRLSDLAFDGGGPGRLVVTSGPAVEYEATGWTRSGRAVPAEELGP